MTAINADKIMIELSPDAFQQLRNYRGQSLSLNYEYTINGNKERLDLDGFRIYRSYPKTGRVFLRH